MYIFYLFKIGLQQDLKHFLGNIYGIVHCCVNVGIETTLVNKYLKRAKDYNKRAKDYNITSFKSIHHRLVKSP
jgi:hypothetical protein